MSLFEYNTRTVRLTTEAYKRMTAQALSEQGLSIWSNDGNANEPPNPQPKCRFIARPCCYSAIAVLPVLRRCVLSPNKDEFSLTFSDRSIIMSAIVAARRPAGEAFDSHHASGDDIAFTRSNGASLQWTRSRAECAMEDSNPSQHHRLAASNPRTPT